MSLAFWVLKLSSKRGAAQVLHTNLEVFQLNRLGFSVFRCTIDMFFFRVEIQLWDYFLLSEVDISLEVVPGVE